MKLSSEDLQQLTAVAIKTAKQAGDIIAEHAPRQVDVLHKDGGDNIASQVVTEVDYLCDKTIRDSLQASCQQFDLALLTEETEDDKARLEKDYFWCVDPMDGTLSFIESKPGYSVSMALVAKSGEPIIGVIHDPHSKITYSGVKGQGAFIDGEVWQADSDSVTAPSVMTLVCDRGFTDTGYFPELEKALTQLAQESGCSALDIRVQTGAAMNAIWVLQHQPAIYIKCPKTAEGGGSSWDFAASAAIYNEHGASATDFYGEPLALNNADTTFMNQGGIIYCASKKKSAAIQSLLSYCS